MANDEHQARIRLLKGINEKLERSSLPPTKKISNNDLRRLSDNLSLVFSFLRNMEHYPKDIPFFDPCSVLQRDHIATDLLDRYAGRDLRRTIQQGSVVKIKQHLAVCSACAARLAHFESQLIAGLHVHRVSGQEPHRPTFDVEGIAGGPTTLSPGIGISAGAQRDDI